MKKIFLILKLLICASICATSMTSCITKKVVGTCYDNITVNDFPAFEKKCIGQTYNQIVTALGAPQRREPDGTGGNILIYENTTTKTVSNALATAYNVNVYTKTYTPGVNTTTQQITQTDYIHYFVNSNNECYKVVTNIPMSHTEKSEPYECKRKKVKWGASIAMWSGIYAAIIGIAVGIACLGE